MHQTIRCSVFVLALTTAALAYGCAREPAASAPPTPPPPAALATPAPVDAGAPSLAHVQILAINDFHGNLEPPAGSNGIVVAAPSDPIASLSGAHTKEDAGVSFVPAGGAAFLAAHLARLRAENPNTVVVSAGDLTGASPLVSSTFKDEPTILAMNRMGLDLEAVGNHDFDRGPAELRRLQSGGGAAGDGGAFPGASFVYLAANVRDETTGKTLFPPYLVRELDGVKIAFVGETLAQTPSVTTREGVAGLRFESEAATVNKLVPELEKQEVAAIVLVIHQGGTQSAGGTYDTCVGFSGDLTGILDALDPAIEVVVSGHTHQAYDCTIGGRLVTSASSYGRVVTKIDLTIDRASRRVIEKKARNVAVTRDVAPDPQVAALVESYREKAAPVTGRVVGYVKRDFAGSAKSAGSASCETPLGDLIADAQRAATGADVAFMNPGGIRGDLLARRPGRPDDAVTYAEVFEVQPFGNTLVTMSLTGAQIVEMLEHQFGSRAEPRILQPSKGFSYRYTYDPATRRGVVKEVRLHGEPLAADRSYRVTVNSFLADGGDGFKVLKNGGARKDGGVDVDAPASFLGKASRAGAPLEPARERRIDGDGCK